MTDKAKDAVGTVVHPRDDWLAKHASEDILDPTLPIVDAHHHLWNRGGHRYLLDELLADTGRGHNVVATVFVDCVAYYREHGPAEMRPVGETEFANGVAAMAASGAHGPTRACAAIVGHADLLRGAAAREVLQAHVQAGNGRFRGVRHAGGWDASAMIRNSHTHPPADLYSLPTFREGFAQLAPLGLSFEAWQYHPQLPMVTALARAFEGTSIILNHIGGPLGAGPYAGKADETFVAWKRDMRELARSPNVSVKLGGLGMPIGLFDFYQRAVPATSVQIAEAWRPWIDACIETFGASRCMFESNFPVDKVSCSYAVLWNAFKRLAAGASAAQRSDLFSGTAQRVYRL